MEARRQTATGIETGYKERAYMHTQGEGENTGRGDCRSDEARRIRDVERVQTLVADYRKTTDQGHSQQPNEKDGVYHFPCWSNLLPSSPVRYRAVHSLGQIRPRFLPKCFSYCLGDGNSPISGSPCSDLPLMAEVRFAFVLASPRLLKLFRPCLDSEMPFSKSLRRSGPVVVIANPNTVGELFLLCT